MKEKRRHKVKIILNTPMACLGVEETTELFIIGMMELLESFQRNHDQNPEKHTIKQTLLSKMKSVDFEKKIPLNDLSGFVMRYMICMVYLSINLRYTEL
jgi:hypothetical protein